jgi:hypothetical protein
MTTNPLFRDIDRGATMSDDGLYRYHLWRRVSSDPRTVLWIMLNPSTADASVDDPTIRRLIGYARAWGYGTLWVVNLYAGRATKPADLWEMEDPGGPRNGRHLEEAAHAADLVVGGWGANAPIGRVWWAINYVGAGRIHALATTKAGQPRHPLYLKADLVPVPWVMP